MSQLLPERRTGSGGSWDAFGELEQLSDRMRRMLEQTFGGSGAVTSQGSRGWAPPVDLEETDDAYVVEADVPGVKREDVEIELLGNELSISGECRQSDRQGTMRRRERRTGRFEYRVMLPDHVDAENVDAKLGDGVLTVRVPKSEQSQRRKIEVTS